MTRPKTPYWPLALAVWLAYTFGRAFEHYGFKVWVLLAGVALGTSSGWLFERVEWRKKAPRDD